MRRLRGEVAQLIIAYSEAAMPMPAKEERAYGDGAPVYKGRADGIRVKGDKGLYP